MSNQQATTFNDPNDLPAHLKALGDMIWWYDHSALNGNAYELLSRSPERPDQKYTPLEYRDMAKTARNQTVKDLVLIQKLCRHVNNLINKEMAEWPADTKQIIEKAKPTSIRDIPIVRE